MQQKNQQGEKGDQPTAEQPVSQQVAKECADNKEQVIEGQPQAVDLVVIGRRPQHPLGQQQRQLPSHAVIAVGGDQLRGVRSGRSQDAVVIGPAPDIIPIGPGDGPLNRVILIDAVIPGQGDAGQQKEDTDYQSAAVGKKIPDLPAPAGKSVGQRAQRRKHKPDYSIRGRRDAALTPYAGIQ